MKRGIMVIILANVSLLTHQLCNTRESYSKQQRTLPISFDLNKWYEEIVMFKDFPANLGKKFSHN